MLSCEKNLVDKEVFLFSPDSMDISRYSPLFNSHLQVCVDRQILPVASDTVDFMLSKNLAVDHTVLQILLQKLGKQNLWLRAREVFKRKYHTLVFTATLTSLHHKCELSKAGNSCRFYYGTRCWVWSVSANVYKWSKIWIRLDSEVCSLRSCSLDSLSVGYYPGVSAPPGFMTLIVPCRLGEVELALTFEMFITVNATVIHHLSEPITSLTITLKR